MSKVNYEWDIETVDLESGDILDHYHGGTLKELPKPGNNEQLVVVRDVWEFDGDLVDRAHWYPFQDESPMFSNGKSVPKKYVKEFQQQYAAGQ